MSDLPHPTTWAVYMLRCRDNSLYTGVTTDIDRRLEEHRSGKGSKYVRSRLPCELVYLLGYTSKTNAMGVEIAIKRMTKANKELLIRTWQP